jgi:hypothetical protein
LWARLGEPTKGLLSGKLQLCLQILVYGETEWMLKTLQLIMITAVKSFMGQGQRLWAKIFVKDINNILRAKLGAYHFGSPAKIGGEWQWKTL